VIFFGPFFRRRRAAATSQEVQEQPLLGPISGEQRTYMPDVPYLLPKDAQEDQRLNYQHHVLYRTISNHYLAPLTQATATTILDVGTGTGIWPMEMASLFP
jgi:tRNA G46 methylase TrmB